MKKSTAKSNLEMKKSDRDHLSKKNFVENDDEKEFEKFIIVKDEVFNSRMKALYKVKTIQRKNAFKVFFEFINCYDLLPLNSKLIVVDSNLTLRKTFNLLLANNVPAAVIWDHVAYDYSGIISISDFMQAITYFYHYGRRDNISELDNWSIASWKIYKGGSSKLVSVSVDRSVQTAVTSFISSKVRQIPIIDKKTGNAMHLLNKKEILKYLFKNMSQLPYPKYMESTIEELNIGTQWNVQTVFGHQKMLDAWILMSEQRKSAIPVLDDSQNIIGLYSKGDAVKILNKKGYTILDSTVSESLKVLSKNFAGGMTCHKNETLMSVISKLVSKNIHSLVIVSMEYKVIGMITLSDVMEFISRENV